MLKKVKLYGDLADFIGHKEFDVVMHTTADAFKFLITNFPKVEAYMSDKNYKILANDYEIGAEEIHSPIGQSDVKIVPVIAGSSGAGRFLAGAAIIGLVMATGGAGAVLGGSGWGWGAANSAAWLAKGAVGLGASLMLSGASSMLFPLPKPKEFSNEEDPRISFSFSGVQNVNRAGTSIPLVYGEIITGSVVISAGVDTNQVQA